MIKIILITILFFTNCKAMKNTGLLNQGQEEAGAIENVDGDINRYELRRMSFDPAITGPGIGMDQLQALQGCKPEDFVAETAQDKCMNAAFAALDKSNVKKELLVDSFAQFYTAFQDELDESPLANFQKALDTTKEGLTADLIPTIHFSQDGTPVCLNFELRDAPSGPIGLIADGVHPEAFSQYLNTGVQLAPGSDALMNLSWKLNGYTPVLDSTLKINYAFITIKTLTDGMTTYPLPIFMTYDEISNYSFKCPKDKKCGINSNIVPSPSACNKFFVRPR